ncbi:hypothetical protein [Saccharothrix yanglingensis]|uniref:DUF2637 domain-containing protein n=1 Tax=Saccharothrix yanglingensis TaxID=659496 RepID=A0ABU0WSV3_9PSEU|nr:hypothetical protein [Saccharothrix yanglingensis]MDQ2582603.1 hypothetical protein [Saccharothrix yanglingensis]
MSVTTLPMPGPDDSRDEVDQAVAEVMRYVAAQAPALVRDETQPAGNRHEVPVRTRRVRRLRAEVDEAHALLSLQGDAAPLAVDSRKVRRSRKRAMQAARLHALAQDAAARAWQASRVRAVLTVVAMTALVGALAWSTTGVHHTLTLNTPVHSAAWWGAWAVEPVISAVLLVVVAARAYLATRGRVLDHPHLNRVERGALAVTLTLNVWPYLPFVAERFEPMTLLAHSIGPLVAVAAVTVMPVIWAEFAGLDHGDTTPADPPVTQAPRAQTSPVTPSPRGTVTTGQEAAGEPSRVPTVSVPAAADTPIVQAKPLPTLSKRAAELLPRVSAAVAAGELPPVPSGSAIRTHLRCGSEYAREIREYLTAHHESEGDR